MKTTNIPAKVVAALLAGLMAAGIFSACGESGNAPSGGNAPGNNGDQLDTAAEPAETEKRFADNLPETDDLGGY
ncbi:MAG: hypothetical protein K6D94_01600, partial [Clostridiales bacterium]|nr:hypothetical protein [Clostridiales bacterium]